MIFQKRICIAACLACAILVGCDQAQTDNSKSQNDPAETNSSQVVDSEDKKEPDPVQQKYSDGGIRNAARDGLVDIVKQGVEAGNDLTVVDSASGMNALQMAAAGGHVEIFKLLIDNADFDLAATEPQKGMNVLHIAAWSGSAKIVQILLDKKMEVDALDKEGKSALIHASSGPFADTVSLLIDRGAKVNLTDQTEKFTALMMAAAVGELEVVKILIANGADATMVDIDGDGAMQFAMQKRHQAVVKYLAEKMASAAPDGK